MCRRALRRALLAALFATAACHDRGSSVASEPSVVFVGTAAAGSARPTDSRQPKRPAKANRAALELVRIDDESDPLAGLEAPTLPGLAVTISNEAAVIPHRRRHPVAVARVRLDPGTTRQEALVHLAPWLASVELPPGSRLAFGEQPIAADDDPAKTPPLRTYLLTGVAAITGRDVIEVGVFSPESSMRPVVRMKLSDGGKERLAALTRDWVGRRAAVVLDGVVMSAPLITGVIDGGELSITLGAEQGSREEAEKLARALSP